MWAFFLLLLLFLPLSLHAQDLGEWSANPFNPESAFNPVSPYGSPFSNQSATNPFATDTPRLYDRQGNYRGKPSTNPYDPDSPGNPYSRYSSPSSPDSTNNRVGAENPYRSDSPTNPYGRGLRIEGK